jgi:hypothetical protein
VVIFHRDAQSAATITEYPTLNQLGGQLRQKVVLLAAVFDREILFSRTPSASNLDGTPRIVPRKPAVEL